MPAITFPEDSVFLSEARAFLGALADTMPLALEFGVQQDVSGFVERQLTARGCQNVEGHVRKGR